MMYDRCRRRRRPRVAKGVQLLQGLVGLALGVVASQRPTYDGFHMLAAKPRYQLASLGAAAAGDGEYSTE